MSEQKQFAWIGIALTGILLLWFVLIALAITTINLGISILLVGMNTMGFLFFLINFGNILEWDIMKT